MSNILQINATPSSGICMMLRTYQKAASIPKATINRPLLTPRAVSALVPFEDPVGVLMLLVGAEVPLADDADFVAPDVDELEPDLLVDLWLVVDIPEAVVVVLLSVGEEVEEEEVELDALVVEVVGEGLVDSTELEPSTVIRSL